MTRKRFAIRKIENSSRPIKNLIRTSSQLGISPVNFHLSTYVSLRKMHYSIRIEFNNETYAVRSYLLWEADVVL